METLRLNSSFEGITRGDQAGSGQIITYFIKSGALLEKFHLASHKMQNRVVLATILIDSLLSS